MRRFSVPVLFALAFVAILIVPYGVVGGSSVSGIAVAASPPASVTVATVASHVTYWSGLRSRLLSDGISASVVQRLGTASYSQWIAALQAWQDGASPLTIYRLLPQVGIPAFSWGQVLEAAVGGCILGATIGGLVGAAAAGIGALPGAGIGCLAGAVAGGVADGAAQSWTNAVSQSTATLVYDASQTAFANEVHQANSQLWSDANMTPETEYYYYRLAAFAALGQLGNSSFNGTQDLIASTILPQFSSIFSAYYGTLDNAVGQLESSAADTGGGTYLVLGPQVNVPPIVGAVITGPTFLYTPGTTEVLGNYTSGVNSCPSDVWMNGTYYAYGSGKLSQEGATLPGIGGYTSSSAPSTSYYCFGTLATRQAIFEATPQNGFSFVVDAAPFCLPSLACTMPAGVGPSPANVVYNGDGSFIEVCFGPSGGNYCNAPDSIDLQLTTVPAADGFDQAWQAVNNLESNAVAQGQAYWQELRSLGYTSASQLPPNYLIPPPFGALPPNLCVLGSPIILPIVGPNGSVNGTSGNLPGSCTTNLNLTEMESLYYAYLQGMSLFFNSTTYLEHQPRACDSLGCAPWGNLNTYAVGDIYIPGAKNSTGTGPETYGNVSTWNVTKDQLILMPELNPLSIPVGRIYDIPANAPLEVYAVQRGEDLSLNGNGSNVPPVSSVSGPRILATAPGDAIYIQFCQVANTPQANCTVSMTTINDTATSLACAIATPGSTSCPSLSSGGGLFSLGGLLGAIGNAICSLTGGAVCGSAASLLAGVLVAIVVLVIVAVAGIAVVRYAMGGNSRAVELRVTGKGGRK